MVHESVIDDGNSRILSLSRGFHNSVGSDSDTAVDSSAHPSPSQPEFSRHPNDNTMRNPEDYATPKEPVPGWPQVAVLMSKTSDFACFSRFSEFQIKSLLYYQAELEILKAELQEEEWEDYRRGDEDAKRYSKRADYLVKSRYGENKRQWEKVVEMRKVMKEYSEYLYFILRFV